MATVPIYEMGTTLAPLRAGLVVPLRNMVTVRNIVAWWRQAINR